MSPLLVLIKDTPNAPALERAGTVLQTLGHARYKDPDAQVCVRVRVRVCVCVYLKHCVAGY